MHEREIVGAVPCACPMSEAKIMIDIVNVLILLRRFSHTADWAGTRHCPYIIDDGALFCSLAGNFSSALVKNQSINHSFFISFKGNTGFYYFDEKIIL